MTYNLPLTKKETELLQRATTAFADSDYAKEFYPAESKRLYEKTSAMLFYVSALEEAEKYRLELEEIISPEQAEEGRNSNEHD